jgi:hypothetical protein
VWGPQINDLVQPLRKRGVQKIIVVVVQVLIAKGDGRDALPHQRLHLMLDQLRIASIQKATGKAVDQSARSASIFPDSEPRCASLVRYAGWRAEKRAIGS